MLFDLLVKLVLFFFVKDHHEEHQLKLNSFHLILLIDQIHVLFDKKQWLHFDEYLSNNLKTISGLSERLLNRYDK